VFQKRPLDATEAVGRVLQAYDDLRVTLFTNPPTRVFLQELPGRLTQRSGALVFVRCPNLDHESPQSCHQDAAHKDIARLFNVGLSSERLES
jgi:hypothetical protein